MLELIVGTLEKIAPWLLDWFRAARKGKSRRLHIFVLKAIGRTDGIIAPDLTGHRFDLASIDRKLQISQQQQALGGDETLDDFVLFGKEFDRKEYRQIFKKQAKLGLPGINDADRQQRIENILHDMVEANKLRFHPPNMWSVL
jgi:hypothetical protein